MQLADVGCDERLAVKKSDTEGGGGAPGLAKILDRVRGVQRCRGAGKYHNLSRHLTVRNKFLELWSALYLL